LLSLSPPLLANFSGRKSFSDLQGVGFHDFRIASFDFDKIIDSYNYLKFSYIDISKAICDQEICFVHDRYGIFYGDSVHFSDYGQRIIVKPLLKLSISEK
jgi:hypothetical protein